MEQPVVRRGFWDLFDTTKPLWMPEGSVRALLTIALLAYTGFLLTVYKWAPPELITLTTAAVMGYIQARGTESSNGPPAK